MKTLILFAFLISTAAFADSVPFKIHGASGVSLAANGFPLTYDVYVKSEIPLLQLVKQIRFEGGYTCGELSLPFKGVVWAYPYSEKVGLLQFLFVVPEDQPKGIYKFSAKLYYGDTEIPLPESDMEIGGPHPY